VSAALRGRASLRLRSLSRGTGCNFASA
jgi:hypothetical protein